MDKKIEMTAEREGKILEKAIVGMSETGATLDAVRVFAELQRVLVLAGQSRIEATKNLETDDMLELIRHAGNFMLKKLLKRAIAEASTRLNMLELIYGDATDEEIKALEVLDKSFSGREEAAEDA